MAGFLYFLDGETRAITLDRVKQLGLGYAISANLETRAAMHNSPSGRSGLTFGDSKRQGGKAVGYYPDQQTWRKLPALEGRPELWVGYWNDSTPRPEDLERSPLLAADVAIKLADGNKWQIPRVREYNGVSGDWECLLPSLYDWGDDGKLFPSKPLAAYQHLWDITTPIAASIVFGNDGEAAPVTDQEIQDAAVALLQANYVVGVYELAAIGALATGDTFASIVLGACRGKTLLSWLEDVSKKNDSQEMANGSNTSDGAAA